MAVNIKRFLVFSKVSDLREPMDNMIFELEISNEILEAIEVVLVQIWIVNVDLEEINLYDIYKKVREI